MIKFAAAIALFALSFSTSAHAGEDKLFIESSDTVSQHSTNVHKFYFTPGLASVIVRGDGSGDFDCFILNDNDDIVASDVSEQDFCSISFTVVFPGAAKIVVYNVSDAENTYSLYVR